jgi:hypothetical protein
MAATITAVVTDTVTKTVAMSATASSTARAKAQGGILEGENPTQYNPKDPIIIFIIQVCAQSAVISGESDIDLEVLGWCDHPLLPFTPLASIEDSTAACHRRSHWWCLARSLGHG